MILFFTISRSISTVVPCTPCAPFSIGSDPVDEVPDSDGMVCISQSRARGTVEVGVGTEAYPVAEETLFTFIAEGLKEERRF